MTVVIVLRLRRVPEASHLYESRFRLFPASSIPLWPGHVWYRYRCPCSSRILRYEDRPPNAHGSSVFGPLTPPPLEIDASSLELAWKRNYLCRVQTNSPTDPPDPGSRLRGVRRNNEVSRVVYPSTETTVKFPSKECTDGPSVRPGLPGGGY